VVFLYHFLIDNENRYHLYSRCSSQKLDVTVPQTIASRGFPSTTLFLKAMRQPPFVAPKFAIQKTSGSPTEPLVFSCENILLDLFQSIEYTAGPHQFIIRSRLYDATAFHDDDVIEALEPGQAMADHDECR